VVIGTIGVCVNGTIGYEILGLLFQPHFYYIGSSGQTIRNIWFAVDRVFLSVYGAGCCVFLYVLMKHTAYGESSLASDRYAPDGAPLRQAPGL
jgi:hypothetical protein